MSERRELSPPGPAHWYLPNSDRWVALQPRSRGFPRSGGGPALTPGCGSALHGSGAPFTGLLGVGLEPRALEEKGLKPNPEKPREQGSAVSRASAHPA